MNSTVTPWQMYGRVLLALTLWREARGEPFTGKVAVAQSIKNRVDHPSWWGGDLISVLTKKWQYSSLTDPNDRQLTTWPKADDADFEECLTIADGVLRERYASPLTRGADSYFDDSLQGDLRPKWAREHPERFVGKIGRLNFYSMDCDVKDPHVPIKETEA